LNPRGGGRDRGSDGSGVGGGLYIESDALVNLDAFTAGHVKFNKASTNDANIHGAYTLLS
jgi:hypothetical protein